MSSLVRNARKFTQNNRWYDYWVNAWSTGQDITTNPNSFVSAEAWRAQVSISEYQKLTGCTVSVNLKNDVPYSGPITVTCYLYTSDPTTGGLGTSVPSGYIQADSKEITISAYTGIFQTFSFSGLNISTSGSYLYFLFTAYRQGASDPYIFLYSYNDGTSGFGTPTVTGTFADMSTTVSTPTASVVDLTGNFPSTYIAGYSKVKVEAAVTTGSGATTSSVVLSYPGGTSVAMSYNSSTGKYEGITAAPITGDTVFTVTATNNTGFSGTNIVSVTGVVPYTTPSVTVNESGTFRCDAGGVKASGGTHFRAQAAANYYSTLSGNALVKFSVKIKGSAAETDLTSNVQSAAISGMANANQSYTVVFTIQDKVSAAVEREYTLEGALRDFVLLRGSDNNGAHVGVGMTPTIMTGRSSIELPSGGQILIGGEQVMIAYPVGSVYMSASSTNPGSLLGGTWEAVQQSAISGVYLWRRTA